MKIKKILNNGAVLTENENNEEVIVLGKGLAYGKKINDEIDKSKIYKVFTPFSGKQKKLLLETIHETDPIFFQISQKIVDRLKHEENIELADSVYITLTDHLATSVERAKKGMYLSNKFLWELKNYYPKEYSYGLWALKLLDKQFNLKFPDDEAGFIAVHIISGELGNDIGDFQKSVNFIKSITKIVKYYFNIDIDYQSLTYNRFAVHLKFFWKGMMYDRNHKEFGDLSQEILKVIKNSDIDSYKCALKIRDYINEKYNYELSNEDIMYLAIHINKIISDYKGREK
ncbi:PRD domain-containing protein [uncultured Lactobacillus sp.]|uniref:PRD domain-containing protein n=1 Tax=uncultured Lactobacillus sp. TaxID=153152 RepID=UPI002635FF32|nr:PRD domain-containing protein [uncultured Lactobacillus sp.]